MAEVISIEAELPDPSELTADICTRVVSSDEMNQLASTSAMVGADEDVSPPPLPDDPSEENDTTRNVPRSAVSREHE